MSQARAWRLLPNHGQLSPAHRHQHEPSLSLFAAWRQKQRQFPNPRAKWKGTSISGLREVLKPIPFRRCRVLSAGVENKHPPPLLKKRIGFGCFTQQQPTKTLNFKRPKGRYFQQYHQHPKHVPRGLRNLGRPDPHLFLCRDRI